MPDSEDEWKTIANVYEKKWNFPHVIGALDGKHIVLQKPINSGSDYYNYKHTCSLVLLALVDANYKFLYIDVGAQGRIGDATVYNNSNLSIKLEHNLLHIPEAKLIGGTDILCPYVIVADDAFAMKSYLLKPYSRRGMVKSEIIFNYRLSRARRVVENAFGILANRFRVFRTAMAVRPYTAKQVVLATTAIHNLLRSRATDDDSDDADEDEDNVVPTGAFRRFDAARNVGRQLDEPRLLRDKLAQYFLGEGVVEWQDKIICMK
jgi:hypothetical protein